MLNDKEQSDLKKGIKVIKGMFVFMSAMYHGNHFYLKKRNK